MDKGDGLRFVGRGSSRDSGGGAREHAGKMHDDLIDAVAWAVRDGIDAIAGLGEARADRARRADG